MIPATGISITFTGISFPATGISITFTGISFPVKVMVWYV